VSTPVTGQRQDGDAMYTETLVGGAIAAGLAIAGWMVNLGSRVTKLEAHHEDYLRRLDKIDSGVQTIDDKLDAVLHGRKK
jgi:hypothetical protein